MKGKKTVTAQIDDPELIEFVEQTDNQSEAVRKGLEIVAMDGMEIPEVDELTEDQREAYHWLLRYSDGSPIFMKIVETELSQRLSMNKELVETSVIKPLDNAGYIDVRPTMENVHVSVNSPSEVESND